MSYLCIFDGDFAYYNESDYFKEGKSYILEKKDLEYETNISFRPYSALQNMDMQISQLLHVFHGNATGLTGSA